jgi:AsmA family protein
MSGALPIPTTPPYALSGSLVRAGETWRLEEFDGHLGGSDLHGTAAVDFGAEPPAVEADLIADVLHVAELKEVFGIPPIAEIIEAAAADDGLIVPVAKLHLGPLRVVDGGLKLRVKRLLAPALPLPGRRCGPRPGLAQGTAGRVRNWGRRAAHLRILLRREGPAHVRDVPLKALFRNSGFAERIDGSIDGRIKLAGRGNALHDLLSGADGGIDLVIHDGGLLVELVGLDVIEALGLYLGEDTAVPIRCLVADLTVEDGIVPTNTLLLDTTDTLITATGQLDLETETIELKVTPEPKDVSVLSLRSTVTIEGGLTGLTVAPDVASLLRMLPPIDLGTAEDAPFDELLERARRELD